MIINSPEKAVGILINTTTNINYPNTFIDQEIREKISSGSPDDLYTYVGLRLGFQKKFTARGIMPDVISTVNSSLLSANKASFVNAYTSNPNLIPNRNYLNHLDSTSIFAQRSEADKMHPSTLLYRGLYTINDLINRRANALPLKRDCKWYEALWCNKEPNRALNAERQRHIDNSAFAMRDNQDKLNRLRIFDAVNLLPRRISEA